MVRLLRNTLDLLEATGGTLPSDEAVAVEDRLVPGPAGAGDVTLRIYSPVAAHANARPGRGVLPRRRVRHG